MGFGLQRFDLGAITRRLELPEVSIDPAKPLTLIVRYCGTGNSLWENAMFRRAVAKREEPTADAPDPDATNARTIETIAESQVVADWEQVAEDGASAPCTPEAVARFLTELLQYRPDVWRRVVGYVITRTNFDPAPQGDAVALGKG
jgi:hypothetical protein